MPKINIRFYPNIFLLFFFLICSFELKSQDKGNLLIDLKVLSSKEMGGRKPGTIGHKLAMEYIIDQYIGSGIIPFYQTYTQPFEMQTSSGQVLGNNIIGMIKGKSDKVIVISAHYDHLGEQGSEIFYGADDNASGVAALFFIADYFKDVTPNHTLVFAAFDGEEYGLLGAKYFVSNLKENKVVLNINMDMISRNDKNEIYACGTKYRPGLKPVLLEVNGQNPEVLLRFGHDEKIKGVQDWTYDSDHGAFHSADIPFIYFGVEDHADYHKQSDTFEKINVDFYQNVVGMILGFVKEMDK